MVTFGPNQDAVAAFISGLGTLDFDAWTAVVDTATPPKTTRMAGQEAAYASGRFDEWIAALNSARETATAQARRHAWIDITSSRPPLSSYFIENNNAALEQAGEFASLAAWRAGLAAEALVVRDLIAPGQFDALTGPMRAADMEF